MANLVIDDITDKIGMFIDEFKNAIMSISLDKTLYLRYILKLRLKEYICFMLVLFTPAAIAGIYIFMLLAGISSALMISVGIMTAGSTAADRPATRSGDRTGNSSRRRQRR